MGVLQTQRERERKRERWPSNSLCIYSFLCKTGGALAGSWTGSYKKQVDWFLSKNYQVAQAIRGKEVSGVFMFVQIQIIIHAYIYSFMSVKEKCEHFFPHPPYLINLWIASCLVYDFLNFIFGD